VFDRPDSILPAEAQHAAELTYRQAGVDIEAGEEAVRLIKADAESTYIPGVLGSIGGFAGMFQLPSGLREPVLVTSTDGVGTKLLLAQETGRLDTVGIDLVAMSVNDVLTVGARPILFLDYVAVGRLQPREMAQIVAGVAEGCRQAGCALIGGEMAEMPGLYSPGEFDLAGFCVGMAERSRIIDGSQVQEGDVVLGLASSGFHSNGYSLVRKVLEVGEIGLAAPLADFLGGLPPAAPRAGVSVRGDATAGAGAAGNDAAPGTPTIADALLRPTRIYVRNVLRLLDDGVPVKAMAHITGGGMIGNLSRVMPKGLSARLHSADWTVPPLFRTIQRLGAIADEEMFATFNMGVGYVLVVDRASVSQARELLRQEGEEVLELGEIGRGAARVTLEGLQ
jgi:phosphoribosylformylglycinamidine cyclo-ligase